MSLDVEQTLESEAARTAGRGRHVVLVGQTFSPDNHEGSGRMNAFAEALVADGWSVSIVAGANSYLTGALPPGHRNRLLHREDGPGYSIYRPATYTGMHRSFGHRALYFAVFMCTSLLAMLRMPRPDVIVGGSPPITVAVAAWLAALARRSTFVLEVRDLWPDFPIQMGVIRNPVLIGVSRLVERCLYRAARVIVFNSPGFRPHLLACGVDPARARLIPNGVDIEAFRPSSGGGEVRRDLGLDDAFVLLYIGAHGPANGLEHLLDIASRTRSDRRIRYLLIGAGKEKGRLVQRASEDGLNNVMFLDPRPKNRMRDYIAAADLCFASLQGIPMFTTTYPNKLFDYMACGRPVMTTIDGVSREVVEGSGCGFYVRHGDVDAAVARIEWAMANRQALEHMGRAGRTAAVTNWDRRFFQRAFVETVAEVCS